MVTAPISGVTSTTRSHRLASALTWVFGLLAGGKKPRARSRHRNIAILVKIKYPAASASSVQRLLCSTHDCTMETASKERTLCSNVPRLSLLWFLFHRLPGPGTPGVGAGGEGAAPRPHPRCPETAAPAAPKNLSKLKFFNHVGLLLSRILKGSSLELPAKGTYTAQCH